MLHGFQLSDSPKQPAKINERIIGKYNISNQIFININFEKYIYNWQITSTYCVDLISFGFFCRNSKRDNTLESFSIKFSGATTRASAMFTYLVISICSIISFSFFENCKTPVSVFLEGFKIVLGTNGILNMWIPSFVSTYSRF